MIYSKEDSYFLSDSHFIFINSGSSCRIKYISGYSSHDVIQYKNYNVFASFAAKLFASEDPIKEAPSFSSLLDNYYTAAYSTNNPEILTKPYAELVNYLHKLHPFFTFHVKSCNYDVADKFLIEVLVKYVYSKNYFSDFAKYSKNQIPQTDFAIKNLIRNYSHTFNKEVVLSFLFPVSCRTFSFGDNYKEYSASSALCNRIYTIGQNYRQKLEEYLISCTHNKKPVNFAKLEMPYDKPFENIYSMLQNYEYLIGEYESHGKLPNLSPEQFYIQTILSKSFYDFNQVLNKCISVDIRKYIYKSVFNKQVLSSTQIADACLELLSQNIQDAVLTDPHYPETESTLIPLLKDSVTFTEFNNFEQLICLELNTLIRQNQLLRICPYCQKAFLTKSRKIKYCSSDRNLGKVYQQKYKERTSEQDDYYKAVDHFKTTLQKRKSRLQGHNDLITLYQDCIWEADDLLRQPHSVSITQFSELLNDLLVKRGLPKIRVRKKN